MPIGHEGIPQRLPDEAHKTGDNNFGKLNSPRRQMAIKALGKHCGPEEISLEEVREMLDKELPGVSLSDMVIEDRGEIFT